MNKYLKIVLLLFSALLLFLVRAYSSDLFYDPFIHYFKNDYLYLETPFFDIWYLTKDMFLRYLLNSSLTLGIIWMLFQKKEIIKFTFVFLLIAFTVLMGFFVFLLKEDFQSGYLLPFYIRRFIIHPLFLLLLIPAFYFQKLAEQSFKN
jgi:exosortase F-associated protein